MMKNVFKSNFFLRPMFDPNTFYNLSEKKLNLDSIETSCWGNLGYWKDDQRNIINDYAQACAQLCHQLADIIDLNDQDLLIDIGFGCGDQLFVWLNDYEITQLYGLNISSSQVALAQQRLLKHKNLKQYVEKIFVGGDKTILKEQHDLTSLVEQYKLQPNKIIAVDCIYHFQNKTMFLQQCHQSLNIEGMLGFSDLVLNRKPQGLFEMLMLRVICFGSRVPYWQLKTHQDYQQELNSLGFEVKKWVDVSSEVFIPFGLWLKEYIPRHPNNGSWLKYRVTAFFLTWLSKRKLLSYSLIGLVKK